MQKNQQIKKLRLVMDFRSSLLVPSLIHDISSPPICYLVAFHPFLHSRMLLSIVFFFFDVYPLLLYFSMNAPLIFGSNLFLQFYFPITI